MTTEILAPAGGAEALRAAVINGADAVYLGLDRFSARAGADNFTFENLREWVRYAHLYGVKVYVAVNTVIKDAELPQALEAVACARECRADAIIVQDIGLIREIRRIMPDVVLHGSTQMGVHNLEGALFARALGLKRVVLSRETSLSEIRRIRAATDLELEYFVHGALCVAFSGNCYVSSALAGLSGNRGRCLQLCRKRYAAECDGKRAEGYWLSPADICLADRLRELTDAGITSFKIEGRLKRKEYVGEVTRLYKKALSQPLDADDAARLKLLFNRGEFCAAYLAGKDVVYPALQSHLGLKVGRVTSVVGKKAAFVLTGHPKGVIVEKGDGLKFVRNGREVGNALSTGERDTTFVGSVRTGDDVRLTTSNALLREICSRERRLAVYVTARVTCGEPALFTALCDGVTVERSGPIVGRAERAPLCAEDIERTLKKCGVYFSVRVDATTDGRSFVPQSALNELRRELYDALADAIVARFEDNGSNRKNVECGANMSLKQHILSDIVYRIDELSPTIPDGNVLYAPVDYGNSSAYGEALARYGDRLILELPIMADTADIEVLKKLIADERLKTVCVNNPYGYTLAVGKQILTGWGMNQTNDAAGGNFMQSPELDGILGDGYYVYAFGYFPLMTFKHCPRRSLYKSCQGCGGTYDMTLTDDKGTFRVRHYKVHECYAQLVNDRPIDVLEEMKKRGHTRLAVDLCGLSEEAARRVSAGIYAGAHTHFNFNKKLV